MDLTALSPLAPVDAEGLARALRPFGTSTMLPAEAYTSPDVLAWERRNLVAGSWACVGRKRLSGIYARNGGAKAGSLHNQDLAGPGRLGRGDW